MTVDHLTMRAIELFIDERGEPPGAFAWVALGSAARHEQALTTDQDHSIAYGAGADVEAIDPYFAALAASVTDALEASGIQRCRGNVMAVNPAWRNTSEGWRQRFGEYVADPDLRGTRIMGIAFDYRRVTGAVDIEATLDEFIRTAGRDQGFVRRLATTALESEPPVGRHRDIAVRHRGEHRGRIDIKHHGITIITNLARVHAILAGVTENRTIERLRGAASAGVITDRTRDDLVEAFRVLWGIRLERHAALMGRGEMADDFVDPAELPKITERALGGSLRVIADAQEHLARELDLPHRRR
jgi:CBS domain-containing protein